MCWPTVKRGIVTDSDFDRRWRQYAQEHAIHDAFTSIDGGYRYSLWSPGGRCWSGIGGSEAAVGALAREIRKDYLFREKFGRSRSWENDWDVPIDWLF